MKKGTKSVFGYSPKTAYKYVDLLNKKFKKDISVLVIDCRDGIGAMPFIRANHHVDCYDGNVTWLQGGIADEINVFGLINKLKYEKLEENVKIYNEKFYNAEVDKKYDLVYVYRSLHLNSNKDIPMHKKIKKILSCVKEGGYVYILYYLASNDKDYINYSKDSYLRSSEIKKYFNDNWKILNIREKDKLNKYYPHPFNNKIHYHRVGYLFAIRKNKRIKHNYHYIINKTKK